MVACDNNNSIEPDKAAVEQYREIPTAKNELTPEEEAAGFRLLFDGESFAGWHGYGGSDVTQRWRIAEGVVEIQGTSASQSDLVTDEEFKNFELRLEWTISEAGNSGVMFNVAETPEYERPWHTGPEVQILDNDGHPDSSATHRAGDLYDLIGSKEEASRPVGEWNESRLVIDSGMVRHWLNGVLTFEVQMWTEAWDELVAGSKFGPMTGFGKHRSGRIVLQDHGDVVAFRNMRIREF
jgi:hypothetical protein